MTSAAVYFTAPGRVELRDEPAAEPGAGQVLVATELSAISAGTEMLIYRGQFPRELADANDSISGALRYPLCYGYASVGRVTSLGSGVDTSWLNRLVFSFQPHRASYVASPDSLLPVPDGLEPEDAVFLPNMETAVNLVQDAEPVLGECALVLGQGIVGLLATALLREFPVEPVVTADRYALRRRASQELGVTAVLDPSFPDFRDQARALLPSNVSGYDVCLEISGNPSALDDAIALTAFSGRIVVGSWYGEKRAPIDLGGVFHRSRISLISSQVSTISPKLGGRWTKDRRFDVAWRAIHRIRPSKWITHRFAIADAGEAYRVLDQSPEEAIQVVFQYSDSVPGKS